MLCFYIMEPMTLIYLYLHIFVPYLLYKGYICVYPNYGFLSEIMIFVFIKGILNYFNNVVVLSSVELALENSKACSC